MPKYIYKGAPTVITLESGKSVTLAKNSAVLLPNDEVWVKRQISLGGLIELPVAVEPKTVKKSSTAKGDK